MTSVPYNPAIRPDSHNDRVGRGHVVRPADRDGEARELAALLARVAMGDRSAFARLFRQTQRDLFGVAYRVLGSRDRAEDALQEAFLNIWHNALNYRPASSQPMTWMTAIVRNKALDTVRSEGRHALRLVSRTDDDAEEAAEATHPDPGPAELFAQASDSLGIRHCMETLEPGPRQALALAYYHGLSQREIGETMGAPVGTVKAWVRRSLDRLRDCLQAAGVA